MNRVKEYRLRIGLQQKDIAIALGVKQAAVSQWENQKSDPKPENIPRLAALLNVPAESIVYDASAAGISLSDTDIDAIAQRVQSRTIPAPDGSSPTRVAFYGATHDLSDDELADVMDFVEFVKAKRNRKN